MDEPRFTILKNGELIEVDLVTWGAWKADSDEWRIAESFVGEVRISTVFIAHNHAFFFPPECFETMVFGGVLDLEIDRYETLEGSMLGHERMVGKVRNCKTPDQ